MINSIESREILFIREFYPGSGSLRPKKLQNILAFVIIWNIFEGILTDKYKTGGFYQKFNRAIIENSKKFRKEDFYNEFLYFLNRYKNEDTQEVLKFRDSPPAEMNASKHVSEILKKSAKEEIPIEDIVKCLGYIIYRFRNNLFHGLKPFDTLPAQDENFKNANIVLINIVDTIKRKN